MDLCILVIHLQSGSRDKTYLRVTETKLNDRKDCGAWRIELRDAVASGGQESLTVELLLSRAVEMYPREISQRERQLVLFTGSHHLYSPYRVKSQTTKVLLPSTQVESYSKNLKPVSMADSAITYGPYANAAAFSAETAPPLSVHFENNNPFLTVTRLERTIELSMWGNIAVEEVVDVKHSGALLKGSFSRYTRQSRSNWHLLRLILPFLRYEFQRENSGVSSVKHFKTILPAAGKSKIGL